jgi:hypothetical protein
MKMRSFESFDATSIGIGAIIVILDIVKGYAGLPSSFQQ